MHGWRDRLQPLYLLLVCIQRNIREIRSGVSRRDWGFPCWGQNGSKAQEMTVSTATISQGPSQCAGYEVATKGDPKPEDFVEYSLYEIRCSPNCYQGGFVKQVRFYELAFTLTSNSEAVIGLFSVVPVCILTVQPALRLTGCSWHLRLLFWEEAGMPSPLQGRLDSVNGVLVELDCVRVWAHQYPHP